MRDFGKTDSSWLRPELVASWREIAAVLFFTTGHFVYVSTLIGIHKFNGHYVNLLPSNYQSYLTVEQSAILALMLGFLRWRGWTPSDFKIRLGWWSSLQGVLLLIAWFVSRFCLLLVLFIIYKYHSSIGLYVATVPHPKIHRLELSWTVLIVFQVVNAYFEELTVMGYAFNQLAAKRGPLFALVATTFLRLLCHTWKDPAFLFATGIQFLIFGIFYWRTRNLWPLILAHASFDILLEAHLASKIFF